MPIIDKNNIHKSLISDIDKICKNKCNKKNLKTISVVLHLHNQLQSLIATNLKKGVVCQ